MKISLLIVEDNSRLRDRWAEIFRQSGHRVFALSGPGPALDVAREQKFEMAILSFSDPDKCLELQRILKERNPACQITLISERPMRERDALVMEAGARNVLLKPFDDVVLEQVVERATRNREKRSITGPDNRAVAEIRGESPEICRTRDLITRIAGVADTSVLICGESGTGKELAARAIHGLSPRCSEPFLELNCAAIPDQLLESELFGYERGAFTSADRTKPGLFELANGGTLFLDEIGELNLELQAKLLRVLDTRLVRRLGGAESTRLNVRILTATNRDLAREVASQRFRADLFHRLNVVQIEMPPLRSRRGDVTVLANHFLMLFRRKLGRERIELAPEVFPALEAHSWPGNVRELMNQIEQAVLVTKGERITLDVLSLSPPPTLRTRGRPADAGAVSVDFSHGPIPLAVIEREVISQALEQASWNISEASRMLGIGRGALRYKIDQLGIERRSLAG